MSIKNEEKLNKIIKYMYLIMVLFLLSVISVRAESDLRIYGFYLGQQFEEAVSNAKERNYTIECVNLISVISNSENKIPGSTIAYEKICPPKRSFTPSKPLQILIQSSAALNNIDLTEEDINLFNYYINQLSINYNSVKPKFFNMSCYSDKDTKIGITFYSKNGLIPYYIIAIRLYDIDKASLPILLNNLDYNKNNLKLLPSGDNSTFYLEDNTKYGLIYKEDEGTVSDIYLFNNFNVKYFFDNIKKDIENKVK